MDERLSPTDLSLWRNTLARKDALEIRPEFFTKDEAVQILVNFYETTGEVLDKYELEEEDFSISPYSGRIVEDEK